MPREAVVVGVVDDVEVVVVTLAVVEVVDCFPKIEFVSETEDNSKVQIKHQIYHQSHNTATREHFKTVICIK